MLRGRYARVYRRACAGHPGGRNAAGTEPSTNDAEHRTRRGGRAAQRAAAGSGRRPPSRASESRRRDHHRDPGQDPGVRPAHRRAVRPDHAHRRGAGPDVVRGSRCGPGHLTGRPRRGRADARAARGRGGPQPGLPAGRLPGRRAGRLAPRHGGRPGRQAVLLGHVDARGRRLRVHERPGHAVVRGLPRGEGAHRRGTARGAAAAPPAHPGPRQPGAVARARRPGRDRLLATAGEGHRGRPESRGPPAIPACSRR